MDVLFRVINNFWCNFDEKRMPLLQESNPNRELIPVQTMKGEQETPLKNHPMNYGYPHFVDPSVFNPSQIIMASQIIAASSLTMSTLSNPRLFQTMASLPWHTTSPPSPPVSNEALSPAPKSRKTPAPSNNNNNNNNNVVSSSTPIDTKKRKWKADEDTVTSLPCQTLSVTPPSACEVKDTGRDKQFICGVCKKSFGYKHVLQNHERTHTGEKPYKCNQCMKCFTRDHHLKTHMRLHTGEKPYTCKVCGKRFVQVANLRRHVRVHTGEKPYTCDFCTAKYSDSNQLKAHIMTHTDEKPFSCERCQRRFRVKHHLLRHKCERVEKEMTPESDEHEEDLRMTRRRVMHRPSTPLVTLPLQLSIPEQTEPEDLSMTTGLNSNSSSGGSPARSASSKEDFEEELDLRKATTI